MENHIYKLLVSQLQVIKPATSQPSEMSDATYVCVKRWPFENKVQLIVLSENYIFYFLL